MAIENGSRRPLTKREVLAIADARARKLFGMTAGRLRGSSVINGWTARSAEARRLATIAEYAKK